tara:strand:- start:4678 stop:4932 length:255 start_codon:yes stop_codon:yes gene_type:complete
MTHRITIGQNQWLVVEWVGKIGGGTTLYQVVEAHRCPQIERGDTIKVDKKGMITAWSDADATRPRYRLPSHTIIEYEGARYEEE